jgi:hypothetical protein
MARKRDDRNQVQPGSATTETSVDTKTTQAEAPPQGPFLEPEANASLQRFLEKKRLERQPTPDQTKAQQERYDQELDALFSGEMDLGLREDHPDLAEDGFYRGIPTLSTMISSYPEDLRKQIHNIQASHTRKMQALAEEKRKLEQERLEVQRERDALSKRLQQQGVEIQQRYAGVQQRLSELPDPAQMSEDDILASKENLDRYLDVMAERKALNAFATTFGPVDSQLRQESEAMAMRQIESDMKSFINDPAHPERADYMSDPGFVQSMKSLLERGIPFQESFDLLSARAEREVQAKLAAGGPTREEQQRDMMRSVRRSVSSAARPPRTIDVNGLSASEIHQRVQEFYKQNGYWPDPPKF